MKKQNKLKDLDGEVWKPILGFEGLYEASNKGRIKRISIKGKKKNRLIHPYRNKQGYYLATLCKNGKTCAKQVHRIVYESFNGNIPKYEILGIGNGDKMFVINHKDENPSNNCIENLEVVSVSYNNKYGTKIQRYIVKRSKIVYQYSINGCFIKEWGSATICGKNGFSRNKVSECCRMKILSYKGFIWSYTLLNDKELAERKECIRNMKKHSKCRKIYQYTINNELIKIWECVKDCDKHGYKSSAVYDCCLGRRKTYNEYIWSYKPLSNN